MMNPEGLTEGKPHILKNLYSKVFSFAELASSVVLI